jgi:hypothetical protein
MVRSINVFGRIPRKAPKAFAIDLSLNIRGKELR